MLHEESRTKSYLVSLEVPHLDLQEREVPENLDVVLVPLEGVPVALDGLVVLLVRALQEAEHVPADVRAEVVAEAAPHEVVGLLLAAQAVEGQTLHGQGLCVQKEGVEDFGVHCALA